MRNWAAEIGKRSNSVPLLPCCGVDAPQDQSATISTKSAVFGSASCKARVEDCRSVPLEQSVEKLLSTLPAFFLSAIHAWVDQQGLRFLVALKKYPTGLELE